MREAERSRAQHLRHYTNASCQKRLFSDVSEDEKKIGDPNGIRTRVAGVKGRCPRPLDDGVGAAWDVAAYGRECNSNQGLDGNYFAVPA